MGFTYLRKKGVKIEQDERNDIYRLIWRKK